VQEIAVKQPAAPPVGRRIWASNTGRWVNARARQGNTFDEGPAAFDKMPPSGERRGGGACYRVRKRRFRGKGVVGLGDGAQNGCAERVKGRLKEKTDKVPVSTFQIREIMKESEER